MDENVKGYIIRESVLFEDGRGFALAENPKAVSSFVTWQFSEEDGQRDHFGGHYCGDEDAARRDYNNRVAAYILDHGVPMRTEQPLPETYRYYSTQRPIDIGTFPKFDREPIGIDNYDSRIPVENGLFAAWGVLTYSVPLTEQQKDDYELRAAPDNPDIPRLAPEQLAQQVQAVGKWEQAKRVPEAKRLTWWYPDFGSFVKKEFVPDTAITDRYNNIAQRQQSKPSIADQLRQAGEQAEKDSTTRPGPKKEADIER